MEGFSQVLPYSFTIFIGLFIVFGFIIGLIRGLKRSVVRLIWLIACIAVLLLTTTLITPAFMDMNISFLNLSYEGQSASTMKEYTALVLSATTKTPVSELGSTLNFAIAIASMFINSFIFAIMFFLLKLVSLPIYAIINKILFHDRNKSKKHILGSIVGAVSGLLVAMTFLTPITGYVELYNDVKKTFSDNPEYLDGLEDADEFIGLYQNDLGVKFINSIGLNKVQLFVFDTVSQANYSGTTFRLMKEKDDFLNVLPALLKAEKDAEANGKYDLNSLLPSLSSLFNSEIMRAAFVEISPVIKSKIQNVDLGSEEYSAQVKDLIIDVIDKLPTLENTKIQETLQTLADTATEIQKLSDKSDCDYEYIGSQIDKLIALDVVSGKKVNQLVYSVAKSFLNTVNEEDALYNISQNILNKLQTGVTSYRKEMSALNIVLDMKDMLTDEFDFTAKGAAFGAKIDELLGVKSEIIDKKFINDLLASTIDDYAKDTLSDDFKVYTDEIKNNLTKVTSYEDEFTYLGKLIDLSTADYSIENINKPDENGKTLGNKLDEIAPSVLVGTIPQSVIGKQLDTYAKSSENAKYKDILDAVKANYEIACEKSVVKGNKDGVTYSDITSAFDEMYKAITTAGSKIVGQTEFNTEITRTTEKELANLTQNMLLGENGTRLVAITVADDILAYIKEKPVLSATQKGKDLIKKLEIYKQYLMRTDNLNNEPYNSEENVFADKYGNHYSTDAEGFTRINRPFSYILEELQNLIS